MNDFARHRARLQTIHDELATRYWANDDIESLITDLSLGMDALISDIFEEHFPAKVIQSNELALFAVGGFGRQELHPGSDIDLLIVAKKPQKHRSEIEQFWQAVFDLNIEVGHSVRDYKSCKTESRNDITVATAMFERRFLIGNPAVIDKLDQVMDKKIWPPEKFYQAKWEEQKQRHRRHDNVEYNLEPNVKSSPGGLRDIHTALWICERQFGTKDTSKLVELGVLTDLERKWLEDGKRFIWWVRFGLHLVAGRKEDRLQFTYQRELAEKLGFVDTDAQRGVERFMHHYYRHVLELTEVNDILFQHFSEVVVPQKKSKDEIINDRFSLANNYIQTRDEQVFESNPSALLELFVIMANRRDIAGVRAATIRLVRENLHLIDDDFRNNPKHTKLFLELLKAPYTLVSQLTRMRRYGVLGRYIPEFGQVIGQMQHDLFHIYTVDAHTMMVIGNMRRFRYRAAEQKFPVAYHCVHTVPKIELLYIAGLYHDIGKGRGGDHSELGANDAADFCDRHGLAHSDKELVCWLVEKHLYMSTVSQREDIYDPDVVHKFATVVKSEMRLDYLYALTVADINATNPTLWNSWRATLLHQLYGEARRMLRRGLESSADRQATVTAFQDRALERLSHAQPSLPITDIVDLWQNLGEDFFLRHSPPQIADLTSKILAHLSAAETAAETDAETKPPSGPFVEIRDIRGDMPGEGATQIYVFTDDKSQLFAGTVVALSQFDLSVVAATINTSHNGLCFDTYTVIDGDGNPLSRDPSLREQIAQALRTAVENPALIKRPSERRLPRQLRELPWPTEVKIESAKDADATVITILASDRPGLLAAIAILFVELDLQLLSAKITTLGERVEDTFVVANADGAPITDPEEIYTLQQTIRQRLDQEIALQSNQASAS